MSAPLLRKPAGVHHDGLVGRGDDAGVVRSEYDARAHAN